MSPFTFSAGTTTPHRMRKRSSSPKRPGTAQTSASAGRGVPSTPSRIPVRSESITPAMSRAESRSPTKLSLRTKTPYPSRIRRPSTAPSAPTSTSTSVTARTRTPSAASSSGSSQSPEPVTPADLSPSPLLPTSASLPSDLDTLDPSTLAQLEQLTLELAALTASTSSTPPQPKKKNVLRRSPRLGNIVEVDTPNGSGRAGLGTPLGGARGCAAEGLGLGLGEVRSAEEVWREVGRLGRELRELEW